MRSKNMFKHKLGILARCRVTGLRGIIIARSENLNMCNRYLIQPRINKDGEVPESYWIDEDDLIKDGVGVSNELNKKEDPPGGPMSKKY
jgi:hypothetical protein